MGPESRNDYIVYLNDVPIAQGQIQLPEITLPADAPELEIPSMFQPMEISMRVEIPKHWRCRSRKRFIKLVMSEGMSRNYAEKLADFTRTLMPYGEAWRTRLIAKKWRG